MENENDPSEKRVDIYTIVFFLAYLFLMALISLSKLAAIIFCAACGVAVLVYVAFWILPYRIGSLERSICKRLEKEGYQYEKKEGELFVTKSNNHFEIQLSDTFNKRIKHLFILYKFTDDVLDRVNQDGWGRAANLINVHNTNTIFVVLDDHFCCCYQTAIGNSNDFMKEFDIAYRATEEALEDYGRLVPLLERDYPNQTGNKNSIGYKQDVL